MTETEGGLVAAGVDEGVVEGVVETTGGCVDVVAGA